MKKGLAQLSVRLIKPRCGGMVMQLCSLQRQLWIICFYLLKLHLKEMLLCVIWQKFGVYALCCHFWGPCEGAKPELNLSRDGGMGAWLQLNCCGITGCHLPALPQALGTRTATGLASTANPQHQLGSCFSSELVQYQSAKLGRWKRARWQWLHLFKALQLSGPW